MASAVSTHIKRLILPVYVPMMFLSAGVSAPVAGFPQYLGALGAPIAVIGVIVSLTGIGNLIADLPGGLILSRGHIRPVMIACYITALAAAVGLAFTRSLPLVAILVLVAGALRSVVITAMMTYVRLTVPSAVRGRALSIVGGSFRLGALIGTLGGGILADRAGLPVAFLLRAACIAASVTALVLGPDRSVGLSGPPVAPGIRGQAASIARGMKGRWSTVFSVGTGVMILTVLRASRRFALPLWGDALSLNVATIGAIISAGAFMDLLLFIPAGVVMDRAGRKVAGSITIAVFSAGLLILPLSHGVSGFVIASLLMGLGNGFGAGINMTFGTDLAPRSGASAFLGLWRLFGDVGMSAGPAMVGAVAAALGLSASMLVTAGIGAVGLFVLAVLAPETLHRGTPDPPRET